LTLSAGIHHNHWDFWVYPALSENDFSNNNDDIYETQVFDQKTIDILQRGGTVLIECGGKIRYGNDVRHSYLPVFWNTSWFKMRPPHTTGSYIQHEHPIFKDFPTEDWQNLQWWELVNNKQVINLAEFPADYQAIVQPIDTWHISRKLGMLIEAQVLNGKLIMTTMDLHSNLEQRLVARQLRYSVLRYMQSEEFIPSLRLEVKTIQNLFENEAPRVDMFTSGNPDELKPKLVF